MRHTSRGTGFWVGIVAGGLLAAGLIAGPDLISGTSGAQETAGRAGSDVVVVRCKLTGQQFAVSAYQGSVSTPARKTESCADTLADLARAGFGIDMAGYSDDVDFVLYTLTR